MASSKKSLPFTRWVFCKLGYLPIRDHYYEPLTFDAAGSKYRGRIAQRLFNGEKDYDFFRSIARPEEFKLNYTEGGINEAGFKFNNGSFESGDAEALYYFVRSLKPNRIIEIGAGHSSLIVHAAMKLNAAEGAQGEHVIIEPYENPWLDKLGATVIRERVELVDDSVFQDLGEGDILFIDSSHVVRAQNDCVFEYTELLPSLGSGVVVHIHDIFSPFDYPEEWLNQTFHLWAEQYLLEAMLANGNDWKVLAPLNWLSKDTEQFSELCPFFEEGRMPGSMWIKKA
nr:class I SAM-dependent methyltransferase [Mariprofundus sp. KV]